MNINQSCNKPFAFCTTVLLTFIFAFANLAFAQEQAKELTLPDTPAAKCLLRLVNCLNDSDKEERDKTIVTIFNSKEDPNDLRQVADVVVKETGGIKIKELVKSEGREIVVICDTGSGNQVKIGIQVETDGDQLIENIQFSPYEPKKFAKAIGDLIPVLSEDGVTAEIARGVWLAKGYGYLVEITDSEVNMFDYTGKFGWQLEDEDDMVTELLFVAGDSKDKARITFHPKETGYNLTRLESLPDSCQPREWTPTLLFDLFADVMTKHYPFFEIRNVDWQARIKEHRPKVNDSMSDSELFDVMESMLLDLNDGHTGLSAEIDGKQRRAITGDPLTITRLRKAKEVSADPKAPGFVRSFMKSIDKSIVEQVLAGKGTKTCANQLTWGFAHEKVGYINIDGMGGYALAADIDSQVKALHKGLNEILAELADTDALIIDITFNGGGSDLFSLEIASHFADKKRVGFSKWPAAAKEYRQDRFVTPYNESNVGGVMYHKPVYLVTNDYTASAAEIFTMCMNAMPHVKTVGKPTSGALSDVLDKTLPNGWSFHTSNEVYVDHDGVCHEGKGVPPKVELEILDPNDVMNIVHHETIAKVVELALKDRLNEKK